MSECCTVAGIECEMGVNKRKCPRHKKEAEVRTDTPEWRLTREGIEAFRKEQHIPPMPFDEPWIEEANNTLKAICDIALASLSAIKPTVWEVSNRTSSVLFSSEDSARQYLSSHPATVSGGMSIIERPVL